MFNKKVKSVGTVSEFLHGPEKPARHFHPAALAPLPLALVAAQPAFASGGAIMVAGETTKESIRTAFDPLINMIITVSYPIAGVMLTVGALMMMIGMKDRATSMITSACLGFLVVQLSPMLLDILFNIGAQI